MMQIEPNQPQPYPPIKCRDSEKSIFPFPFSLVGEGEGVPKKTEAQIKRLGNRVEVKTRRDFMVNLQRHQSVRTYNKEKFNLEISRIFS